MGCPIGSACRIDAVVPCTFAELEDDKAISACTEALVNRPVDVIGPELPFETGKAKVRYLLLDAWLRSGLTKTSSKQRLKMDLSHKEGAQ